jgi:ferredoxin-NADP reductase/cytochrome b involved in lipid metabolism
MTTSAAESPSRAALRRAERASAAAGHENLGFLSESHGFLPREPPRLHLPESHRAWDDLAGRQPELWRSAAARRAIAELPVLRAAGLPEADLWRASCLLSIFAHSYVRVEMSAAGDLPLAVQQPWNELSERLGRPRRFLSYNDLIVYNWRLRDPSRPDPMRVENLDLLVPTVGSEEERVFYLTQLEILAQCTPIIGAVVRAQDAVVRNDAAGVETELLLILERLRHVTEVSFPKIDPNPHSPTYVDPVVWATTVAPFAVAIEEGTAGPSGTSSPIFHLLDSFFGRRTFASVLGREIRHLREWFPAHQQHFLAAVDEVSVPEYVARGNRALRGLFATALDAYAGPKGYLGTHRLKVYGYLELAFKVGRSITIGGFAGAFRDRAWKEVDEALESSRQERYPDLPLRARRAAVAGREPLAPTVQRVVLDVAESGLPYRPGDHCRVLPENEPELVARTLAALRASGEEAIPLTRAWRELIRLRPQYDGKPAEELDLAEFLRYAKLRPLVRPVAKALLAVTASERLDAIVEARREDQWELWDVLELLAAEGYDTRRLWRSGLWQEEAIARIVPPEPFRTYSISSAPDGPLAGTLELTVGRLEYASLDGVRRRGTASTYMTDDRAERNGALAIDVVRAARFRLPEDASRPIVMFAGGTGVAPFRGFLQAREPGSGENWLFVGARSAEEIFYREELERLVAKGRLELRVALSRAADTPARLPEVMEREENATELWRLLRERDDGGAGACVYVCGRAAFAAAVVDALRRIVARFTGADEAALFVRRLVAERRLMQDVFTTAAAHAAPGVAGDGLYKVSELVLHNDDEHGYWLAVNGNVHDLTEFMGLHPGGPAILRESAGLDASREYRAVLHHESPEVDALLPMYKIGALRRLDFASRWGIALVPSEGVSYVPLRDLFRAWVRYLYLVVEMENALRNDYGYLRGALTAGDDPFELNALKVQLAANTHARFLEAYFDGSLGADIRRLFALTVGLCAPAEPLDRLGRELEAALQTAQGRATRELSERARSLYRRVDAGDERAAAFCASVPRHDARFLAELKLAVREGILVFEELGAATAEEGGERLVGSLLGTVEVARRYCTGFLDEVGELCADL